MLLRAAALAAAAAVASSSSSLTPSAAAKNASVIVVDLLTPPAPPPPVVFAVQVCAGLLNRNASGPGVYTLMHAEDAGWLATLYPAVPSPPPVTPLPALLARCLGPGGPAAGVLRYNFTGQQALVPALVTVAAALDAVPLEDGSPFAPPGAHVVFDAVEQWAGFSPLNATAAIAAAFLPATTGMAKMDPGYDLSDPLAPRLTGTPDLSLVDYLVAARLFNFYLLNGCVPGTPDNALVADIAAHNPWPRPTAVLGYDDTWPLFGGDTFEAETLCVAAHSMGQVATAGVNNLAFFARAPPVSAPLAQPPTPAVAFDPTKTYITFVVGDGDNVAFVKGSRAGWMRARAAACAAAPGGRCPFPLAWSLSPHLATLAPDMLRWYFTLAGTTGGDYFVLPPSGHLYAYPGLMGPDDQAAFVAATEADAALLNTSGTVAWEFVGTWAGAVASYFPRYARDGVVRALFAVNVPFMFPIAEVFGLNITGPPFFVAVGGGPSPAVLFRPNEWRGTSGGSVLPPFTLNATAFAGEINAYPPGTVTHIYLTSDGGGTWSDFSDLAAALAPHVVVVPPAAIAGLARASAEWEAAAAAAAGDSPPGS
jgi:hypothetical protein